MVCKVITLALLMKKAYMRVYGPKLISLCRTTTQNNAVKTYPLVSSFLLIFALEKS